MSKRKKLDIEERNSIIWVERCAGVTGVVIKGRGKTNHSFPHGSLKLLEADAKSVSLRLYLNKGFYRDLFVHANASGSRDKWLREMSALQAPSVPKVEVLSTRLTHVIEQAASFPTNVPTPLPLGGHAGQKYDVSPELAAKWLERNTRNRALRSAVVFKYAADMKAGLWQLSPDCIAFDRNGAVVNGQHRLWAVLESGVTVPMLVVFDLDPNVILVLDDHLKRKMVDVERIMRPGSSVQTKHTACARAMMFNLTAVDKTGSLERASRQRQLAFLERHLDAIEFVIKDCYHSANARGLTNANIMAVMARAYYTQDRERIKQFGKVLLSGMPEGADDGMAIVLRNWLQSLDTRNVRAKGSTIYAKVERALMAFLTHEHKQSLYEATTELFPLPEEQAPKKVKK